MMSTVTLHELKTSPPFFRAVWDGDKTFEVRFDDRGFQKGDKFLLREWDNRLDCSCRDHARFHGDSCPKYTGRWLAGEIGYVLAQTGTYQGGQGFNGKGYVVFSLLLSEASDPELTKELQA